MRHFLALLLVLLLCAGCSALSGLRLCVDMPTVAPAPSSSSSAQGAGGAP